MWSLKAPSHSGGLTRADSGYRICLLLLLAVFLATNVWAFEDPLQSASVISPLASKTLLVDVVRTGDRIVAVGDRGHILFSDDNGQNWQQVQVPVRELLTAVSFPDGGKTGWAVGHSGVILVTQDAGVTWTKQYDGNQLNQLLVDSFTQAVAAKKEELAAAAAKDQGRLQDELENLKYLLSDSEDFKKDGPTRPFLDVCFRNDKEGMAVGQFGLIVQTRDGGKTWTTPAAAINNPDGLHFNSIWWQDGTWFLAGERGFVARSLDDGKSWKVLETPYDGSFFAIRADQRSVVAVGLRGHAVISFDQGKSWESVDTGTQTTLSSVQFLSDGRMLVSDYGEHLLISDAARTKLTRLPWFAGTSVSSFVLAKDGSLVTVGVGGINRIEKDNFSTEVK